MRRHVIRHPALLVREEDKACECLVEVDLLVDKGVRTGRPLAAMWVAGGVALDFDFVFCTHSRSAVGS